LNGAAAAGPSPPDILIATAAIVSVLIAALALLESWRALRVAGVESYPVPIKKGVFLGVQLRNFGPRYAKNVGWTVHVRSPGGELRYEQSLRIPILAPGDVREIVIGSNAADRENRTLQALADEGGSLVSRWDWQDGRRVLFYEQHHRQHLTLALPEILDDFGSALQRQPDETLAALESIRFAIDRLARRATEEDEREGPRESLLAWGWTVIEKFFRGGRD
jgi:hypothetical protein